MDEYIEKQTAIELLERHGLGKGSVLGRHSGKCDIAAELIASITPADVRPVVRGRWIPVTNGRGGHECDQCHEYAPSYQSGSEYLSNFCPKCGSYNGGDAE